MVHAYREAFPFCAANAPSAHRSTSPWMGIFLFVQSIQGLANQSKHSAQDVKTKFELIPSWVLGNNLDPPKVSLWPQSYAHCMHMFT